MRRATRIGKSRQELTPRVGIHIGGMEEQTRLPTSTGRLWHILGYCFAAEPILRPVLGSRIGLSAESQQSELESICFTFDSRLGFALLRHGSGLMLLQKRFSRMQDGRRDPDWEVLCDSFFEARQSYLRLQACKIRPPHI